MIFSAKVRRWWKQPARLPLRHMLSDLCDGPWIPLDYVYSDLVQEIASPNRSDLSGLCQWSLMLGMYGAALGGAVGATVLHNVLWMFPGALGGFLAGFLLVPGAIILVGPFVWPVFAAIGGYRTGRSLLRWQLRQEELRRTNPAAGAESCFGFMRYEQRVDCVERLRERFPNDFAALAVRQRKGIKPPPPAQPRTAKILRFPGGNIDRL